MSTTMAEQCMSTTMTGTMYVNNKQQCVSTTIAEQWMSTTMAEQ